ncbi:MAG: precorrin-8X methylmutase [Thermodesulfobacteriota bacterium]
MSSATNNDPKSIEDRSFRIIDQEVPEPRPYSGDKWQVVRRMIHASADFDLLSLVQFQGDAIQSGVTALQNGCSIVTDTQMVKAGITSTRMDKLGCQIKCFVNDQEVVQEAKQQNQTRSKLAVEKAIPYLKGGIFVVGNAPTALYSLLEIINRENLQPALVVAMPVGFVEAVESKDEILKSDLPCIAVKGRKGGSSLAAACINSLAEIALNNK